MFYMDALTPFRVYLSDFFFERRGKDSFIFHDKVSLGSNGPNAQGPFMAEAQVRKGIRGSTFSNGNVRWCQK